MIRNTKRSTLGFTLIEIAIVLGIVGLVAGAIFAAWGSVSSQSRLRSAEEQISMIVNQIRSAYGNRNSMENESGAVFTNALVTAGLLADSWVETTNGVSTLRNPYGGTVIVTPETYSSGSIYDGINVTMSSLSRTDCKKLANDMVGVGRREGLYRIDATNVSNTTQFSDVASNVCTSNGANSIRFYFSLKTGD